MTALAFAVGVWWTSNTIAHHFIHRPFFRRRSLNRLFAAGMSVAVGYPQALWRERHLAHHAGVTPRLRLSAELVVQAVLVMALWAVLLDGAPMFFATVYLPGYLGGLALCAVHGHYEHAGGTISHYGRLYNVLLFNDGYHVEHHAHPGVPWSSLPERRDPASRASVWPAPLRWLEPVTSAFTRVEIARSAALQGGPSVRRRSVGAELAPPGLGPTKVGPYGLRDETPAPASQCAPGRTIVCLELLERLVLRSRVLQRFVLRTHERALRDLVARLPRVDRVAIVGGGLFPRTAIVLRKLLPGARLTVIDTSRANLERARQWLGADDVAFVHARYPVSGTSDTVDVVVIPLAFDGDREELYARPPAAALIVHDWLWRSRGASRVVSVALLKRVNLVTRV